MFKVFTSAFFLCLVSILPAQLSVKNHFVITGKKDVAVTCLVQDLSGFLWFATPEAVFRFDGKKAEKWFENSGVALKDVSALFVDSKDRLWIGTRKGRIFFHNNNRLDSLITDNEDKVTSFCEVNSALFVGTYGNGIYCYNGKQVAHYTSENGLGDDVIYQVCGDAGLVWCATDGGITLIEFKGDKPRFQVISGKDGLPDNIVRCIRKHEKRLVIGMQDSGVCYFDIEKRKVLKSTFFSNWTMGAVINVYQNNNGSILLATEKNGMLTLESGKISVYNYSDLMQVSVVNQMLTDREQQIWIAHPRGLSHFTRGRYNFISEKDGLQDDKVLAVTVDNNNGIWVGTTTGISCVMKNDMGMLVSKKILVSGKHILSCATKDPFGNIWFGTYGNGVIILEPAGSGSMVINSATGALPNDNISHISFDENKVYISTLGGGLVIGEYKNENGKYIYRHQQTFTEINGLGSNYVYAALRVDKRIYLATDGGGLEMIENSKVINLCKKFKLRSNTVFSLTHDIKGNIWATSNADGIIKYNSKSILTFNSSKGLRDEQPQQIIASGKFLYAFSSMGLDKIGLENDEILYQDLNENDFDPNLNAVTIFQDHIFSGTNNGILTYRTNHTAADSIKPRIYLRSFFLNYKPFPQDSLFEFRYNQNSMGFVFDGIWMKNPGKLRFRYRLNGLEDEWQYSDEGKRADYNNLNPGNYTFIVQVKNDEGIWSDPTGYSFIIHTPLWKRWWFWILVVTIGAFGVYLFIRYRLKNLQKENLLLEKRVKERTQQIEKQSAIIAEKNAELEQLSLVASKTDNVVVILDSEGKLEYINESFEKQSGISIDQLKKEYGDTIFELSNNPDIRSLIEEAVNQKKSVSYESLNRKAAAGAEVWESSTLTPIFEDDGSLKKIIIIDTDVTLRKKQEQIIVQKNKDITDSIAYARKIQHAILPSQKLIKSHLPELFVLYLTKDIVSGDFYWFTHIDNCSIIAAVDCTGHGVPGAFMSLIGYNLLNRIVNEKRITDPGKILFELNQGVLGVLHKNESESKDGMDIAICKINHGKNTLEYAGAMRPLWIAGDRGNGREITEIRADKIPIGTLQRDREAQIKFTVHELPLKESDTFYIFTDGYADQFGGPKDKKFSTSRFKELLLRASEMNVADQEETLKAEHLSWKGDNEQVDDILVIGLRPVNRS